MQSLAEIDSVNVVFQGGKVESLIGLDAGLKVLMEFRERITGG